jgi:hypothetical protein
VLASEPSSGACEGSTPTVGGDHLDGGGGSIKAIGPGSGWPRERDYRRTLGYCIVFIPPGSDPSVILPSLRVWSTNTGALV